MAFFLPVPIFRPRSIRECTAILTGTVPAALTTTGLLRTASTSYFFEVGPSTETSIEALHTTLCQQRLARYSSHAT